MKTSAARPPGYHNGPLGEGDPLLVKAPFKQLRRRYRNTRKCVSSKAAILVLVWSYLIILEYSFVRQLKGSEQVSKLPHFEYFLVAVSAASAISYCFYPLAGYLADNKFGRYKTVVICMWIVLPALVLYIISATVLTALTSQEDSASNGWLFLILVSGAAFLIASFLLTVGYIGFSANVIQFGLDQLHDSPGEDQSVFINWFMWTQYAAIFTHNLLLVITPYVRDLLVHFVLLGSAFIVMALLLVASLCVGHRRRRWFLIDPGRLNPYRLVYQVSKFAHQHKVPVNRSAFTYCEDEIPSGLDLGKDKYGGPFTMEQVEDVKAFYGILKVLFSLGPAFFVEYVNKTLSLSKFHPSNNTFENYLINDTALGNLKLTETILVDGYILSNLIVVACVPFYLFILRPFVSYYIPGMLKRMGIAMIVVLFSLISAFLLETMLDVDNKDLGCMFSDTGRHNKDRYNASTEPLSITDTEYLAFFKIIQRPISALFEMIFYVALYEFICSQSPHTMKGLLIGVSFAIKGVFQILSQVFDIPFTFYWNANSFPGCGMVYCLVIVGASVCAMLVYMCAARRYRYRERDEPCHVRRFVENYYSNIQHARLHNYD